MPTSITVVATSTSAPPAAKAAIASCFSRGFICPCRSTTRNSRSSVVRSRSAEYERLRTTELREFRVVLLHGQMKPREKQEAMAAFAAGGADVLVATTVIEVGIDVPNASVMLVEGAERYGISQLHQLRGRIGRGRHE